MYISNLVTVIKMDPYLDIYDDQVYNYNKILQYTQFQY